MLAIPSCHKRKCKHNLRIEQPDGTEKSEMVVCNAFRGGIPQEIAYGDNKHLEPFLGQGNNIVYEKED